MDALEYARHGRQTVPGWFDPEDALAFVAFGRLQRALAVSGSLVEVGAYLGRSAILLGCLAESNEQVFVIDPFEMPAVEDEQRREQARFYSTLTQSRFEENYLRFHRALPTIFRGLSVDHLPALEGPCRLIHIDGSHQYDAVKGDLAHAIRMGDPDGLIVMDDMVNVHTPGVTAAVWSAIARGDIVPLIQTKKMYATVPGSRLTTTAITDSLADVGISVVDRHKVYDHEVLEISAPAGAFHTRLRLHDYLVPPGLLALRRRLLSRRSKTD